MDLRSTDGGANECINICIRHPIGFFRSFRIKKCLAGVSIAGLVSFWPGIGLGQTVTNGSEVPASIVTGSEVLQTTSVNACIQSNSTSSLAAQIQAYQQEQRSLAASLKALIAEGATGQQLQEWRQQNAVGFQAQLQRAQAVSMAQALQPQPVARQANIPPNASPALKDFITAQTALGNARARIHNQLLQALPVNPGSMAVNQMNRQVEQTFMQEHVVDLQAQSRRAQSLAQLSASVPLKVPGAAVFPPGISPLMKAYMTTSNGLAAGYARTWNQYLNASPQVRRAAMQQWIQENAAGYQQLRQMATNLVVPRNSN